MTFAEGVATGAPAQVFLEASAFTQAVDDAAFVTAKGSAAENGDVYYNTTSNVIRFHKNSVWTVVQDTGELEALLNANGDQSAADGTAALRVAMSDATDVAIKYDSTLTSKWKAGEVGSESEIITAAGSQTVSGSKTFSAITTFSDTTQSTTKDDGAVILEGGIGVEKNLNVGGNVIIDGDLTVSGTTTTIDTSTLDVTDANITVNDGGNQASANSNDAGLTVEMSDATDAIIHYDSTATSFWKVGEVGSSVEVADISSSQVFTGKDIDGGTASDTSRITLSKDTTVNLSGLTRKQGTIFYDTTTDQVVFDDGSALAPIASASGLVESLSVKSADYTVLDSDGFTTIVVNDTTADRTITLPTAADNTSRSILIKNTSTQKGKVTIDGEGAETVEFLSSVPLDFKGAYAEVQCDGSNWIVKATNLGSPFKKYDMTATGTNWTTSIAYAYPYQVLDGSERWRLKFNICGTVSPGANGLTLSLTGVTFLSGGNNLQAVALTNSSGGDHAQTAYCGPGTGNLELDFSSSSSRFNISGDVELDSKPTFVD